MVAQPSLPRLEQPPPLLVFVAGDLACGEPPLQDVKRAAVGPPRFAPVERITHTIRAIAPPQKVIIIVQPQKPIVPPLHHIVGTSEASMSHPGWGGRGPKDPPRVKKASQTRGGRPRRCATKDFPGQLRSSWVL